MTAMHSVKTSTTPNLKLVPKHAAPKLTFFDKLHALADARALRKGVEGQKISPVRLVPTGRADFAVDSKGEVSRTLLTRSAQGISSFTQTTGEAIVAANTSNWLFELLESEEDRRARVNAQAVGQILIIIAALAGRGVARRK